MLLELNFCTCLLELAFDLLGLLLGNTLFHGLGSTVYESLCITERETCDILHGLDDLEFSLAGVLQDHVEGRFLGSSGLTGTGSGSCNGNSGSSRFNAMVKLCTNPHYFQKKSTETLAFFFFFLCDFYFLMLCLHSPIDFHFFGL